MRQSRVTKGLRKRRLGLWRSGGPRRGTKRWSQGEVAFLRGRYSKYDTFWLAAQMGRTVNAVWKKASELGIVKMKSGYGFKLGQPDEFVKFIRRAFIKKVGRSVSDS